MDKRKLITGLTLAALAGPAAMADDPNKAEMETVPQKIHPDQPSTVWVADGGETEYQVKVTLDNTDLNPERTDAAQWRFENAPEFNFTGLSLPSSEDFFEGIQMQPGQNYLSPPGGLAMRMVDEFGTGPFNHSGNLGEYFFTVPFGTQPGFYSFDLGLDTKILDDTFPMRQQQPLEIINHEVYIAPVNPADFHFPPEITRDGYIDNQDAQYFMDNMNGQGYSSVADIDGDGDADLEDIARLQRCYDPNNPVSSPECE